jgi:general transcription factor 3C polypeptide 5 (transcription factor C subunit 1)
MPEEREDYLIPEEIVIDPQLSDEPVGNSPAMKSNMRMFSPPLFSRQNVPQHYGYSFSKIVYTLYTHLQPRFKANSASVVTTSTNEETGVETKRLINRMRWKGYGPTSILFTEPGVSGPLSYPWSVSRYHRFQPVLLRLSAV